MKYEEIKRLMDDMGESKLTSIDIEFPDGVKISMKKEAETKEKKETLPIVKEPQSMIINEEKIDGKEIKSPMVGTFYSKSSPTANKYVEVGSKVKKGDILCIIEAMKLMNEIESEFDGEIVKICVEDGEMVDYGKTLFIIK